jgi:hypothetical protein
MLAATTQTKNRQAWEVLVQEDELQACAVLRLHPFESWERGLESLCLGVLVRTSPYGRNVVDRRSPGEVGQCHVALAGVGSPGEQEGSAHVAGGIPSEGWAAGARSLA